MRTKTHIKAIFAAVLSAGLLTGCHFDEDNPAHQEASTPLIGGATQAAREREEAAAKERKRRTFRQRLLAQQQEGEGDSGSGGSSGH